MKIYGIKNCDTVKKTLNWFDQHNLKYEFHDFKKLGVEKEKLKEWAGQVGYEALLNKKGTTWKKLDPEVQNAISSEDAAFGLMQEKTSVIKRPVLEADGKIMLGYNESLLNELIK